MCDVCKTKHIAISQGFKSRSKKSCSCPWQPETVVGKCYSTTLIKYKKKNANMQDLGYRADDLVDRGIISPVFMKQTRLVKKKKDTDTSNLFQNTGRDTLTVYLLAKSIIQAQ